MVGVLLPVLGSLEQDAIKIIPTAIDRNCFIYNLIVEGTSFAESNYE
jgi:hypothetical protein